MKPKIPHLDRKSRTASYKSVLITFFTLVQIQGILSLSFGLWLFIRIRVFTCAFLDKYYSGSTILIAAGCMSIIMCTIGITRTVRYNTFPLFSHFILFFMIILVLEFSASIMTTVNHVSLHEDFQQNLSNDFQNFVIDNTDKVKNSWAENSLVCWKAIQYKFKCCGVSGSENWIIFNGNSLSQNISTYGLESCACSLEENIDGSCILNTVQNKLPLNTYIYSTSCYDKLLAELEFYSTFLRVYPTVLIVTQIMCFIVLSYYINKIRNINIIATYSVKEDRTVFSPEITTAKLDQCTL